MNTRFLCFVMVCLVPYFVNSQNISDAFKAIDVSYGTPEATEMAKYGNMDVSLYKGVPNIGVPIHQFQLGSLNFPVSLQYNAGGMQVDQIASNVGLGWTIHGSGQITQVVNSLNDFSVNIDAKVLDANVLANFAPNSSPYGADYGYLWDENKGEMEQRNFKPDVFYYNYGATNGKFVLGGSNIYSGPYYSVPFNNNRISYVSGRFEIVDAQGNTYIFDQKESTTTRQSCSGGFGVSSFTEKPSTQSDTWHLGKIITSNGDELRFTYVTEGVFTYQLPDILQKYKFNTGSSSCQQTNIPDYRCYVYKDVMPKYLSTIKWVRNGVTLEEVDFYYNQSRQDFGSSYGALSDITVKKGGLTSSTWDFNYDYFTSSGGSTQAYKRLKLTSIQQSGMPAHTFQYEEGIGMPHRGSFAQDLRGFYNGKTSNASLIPNSSGLPTGVGDRSPDFVKMKAWSLKKHTYPTKGSSEYTMEGYWGGLRVNKITNKDSDGTTIRTRNYTYGGYSMNSVNYRDDYEKYLNSDSSGSPSCKYYVYSASEVVPVNILENGGVTGFRKVTIQDEQNGSQGKTEIEFSTKVYELQSGLIGADDVLNRAKSYFKS